MLSSLHIDYTPVIPFDNFTDVLGLFENYLICIFINIDIKKTMTSLENHGKITLEPVHVKRYKLVTKFKI